MPYHAVYLYRKFTPNIKRPSISYREIHRSKKEARVSAKRWREQVRKENKRGYNTGWGPVYVRVREVKTLRAMRKRSITPYPARKKKRKR